MLVDNKNICSHPASTPPLQSLSPMQPFFASSSASLKKISFHECWKMSILFSKENSDIKKHRSMQSSFTFYCQIVELSQIIQNGKSCKKIVTNHQNWKKKNKLSKPFVNMLVNSCLLINLIKCLKVQWSMVSIFVCQKQKYPEVSQSVTKGHLLSRSGLQQISSEFAVICFVLLIHVVVRWILNLENFKLWWPFGVNQSSASCHIFT